MKRVIMAGFCLAVAFMVGCAGLTNRTINDTASRDAFTFALGGAGTNDLGGVALDITNGTFTTAGGANIFVLKNVQIFYGGGTFLSNTLSKTLQPKISYKAENPVAAEAPPETNRLLVVGDSWAAGHVAETQNDTGWPAMMEVKESLRQGVDGTTAVQWSQDQNGMLEKAMTTPCDAIVVSLMGNDAFAAYGDKQVTVDEIGASCTAMSNVVARLQTKGVPVYVLTYANPYPNDWKASMACLAINAAIVRACPETARIIRSATVLNESACWANNDFHPSFEGHVRLANLIKETVFP